MISSINLSKLDTSRLSDKNQQKTATPYFWRPRR
jgi:hypothetical protein